MDIAELLAFAVKNKASDLHLSAGLPPMIRVHGDIRRINLPPMEHEDVHAMVYDIMSDAQRKTYEELLECDFSFGIPNLARFRVNAFNQERGAAVAFRTIPSKVLSLEELNAPKVFADLTTRPRGLILVTGPTGSGKSTTLAAMINHVNERDRKSTRLNSSHPSISYAVFCLKKKTNNTNLMTLYTRHLLYPTDIYGGMLIHHPPSGPDYI